MKSWGFLKPLLAGTLLVSSVPVMAQSTTRQESYSPTMVCQGALPAFEGQLRKRPLAIANEGNQTAFVTCGLKMEENLSYGSRWVGVYLRNRGAVAVNISCTLVEEFGPHYYTKTIQFAPGEEKLIDWVGILTTPELRNTFQYPSVSCALPPTTEIYRVFQVWEQAL